MTEEKMFARTMVEFALMVAGRLLADYASPWWIVLTLVAGIVFMADVFWQVSQLTLARPVSTKLADWLHAASAVIICVASIFVPAMLVVPASWRVACWAVLCALMLAVVVLELIASKQ